jgi:phage replication-related protein YjqB (UPF0714/DUF867 family)
VSTTGHSGAWRRTPTSEQVPVVADEPGPTGERRVNYVGSAEGPGMDAARRGLPAARSVAGLGGGASDGDAGSETTDPVATLRADGGRTTVPLVVSGELTDPEAVTLPSTVRAAVGVDSGHQLRLIADGEYAVYTVRAPARDAEPVEESVARVSPDGAERVGDPQDRADVALDTQVVDPGLSPAAARARGECTEGLVAGDDRLVACAPHGGFVEPGTGRQARQVAGAAGATAWYTAGYRDGGGAFDRWHITSTDLSRASYPRLDAIADRGFDRAVAFHGWSDTGVGIGGLAPETERLRLRDRIVAETPLDARLVREGEYAGDTESNVVNWLTADGRSGVQVEQSRRAREEFGGTIAGVVASLFG